jgi:hypothetical protein
MCNVRTIHRPSTDHHVNNICIKSIENIMASYGTVPLNNGPAYAQPAYAPIDASGTAVSANQYMLEQHSTKAVSTSVPLQGGSVCVWDATGNFFCEGNQPPLTNGRYLQDVTSGSAMLFEGFRASANAGNLRKGTEGFCGSCSVDVPTPFQ